MDSAAPARSTSRNISCWQRLWEVLVAVCTGLCCWFDDWDADDLPMYIPMGIPLLPLQPQAPPLVPRPRRPPPAPRPARKYNRMVDLLSMDEAAIASLFPRCSAYRRLRPPPPALLSPLQAAMELMSQLELPGTKWQDVQLHVHRDNAPCRVLEQLLAQHEAPTPVGLPRIVEVLLKPGITLEDGSTLTEVLMTPGPVLHFPVNTCPEPGDPGDPGELAVLQQAGPASSPSSSSSSSPSSELPSWSLEVLVRVRRSRGGLWMLPLGEDCCCVLPQTYYLLSGDLTSRLCFLAGVRTPCWCPCALCTCVRGTMDTDVPLGEELERRYVAALKRAQRLVQAEVYGPGKPRRDSDTSNDISDCDLRTNNSSPCASELSMRLGRNEWLV